MNSRSVDILLAVFNAEPFLKEQIRSIHGQSYQEWHLIIRDDCSSDATLEIVSEEIAACPSRIYLLNSGGKNLGASRNFAELMGQSTAQYIMFCDQDDVWLPEKVQLTFDKMRQMEQAFGEATPLLVHTDLKVTNKSLEVISDSLWRYQLSDPERGCRLNRLLMQNAVTGCSMMINRSLLKLAFPIPDASIMHDWWLALVAAAFGKIGAVHEATVLYRQHGNNDTGAKRWDWIKLARSLFKGDERRKQLQRNKTERRRIEAQVVCFLQRYEQTLKPQQRKMLRAFVALSTQSFLARRYNTIRYGFYYTGLARNIVRLLTI